MRVRYVYRGGAWVEDVGQPAEVQARGYVMTDEMEPLRHPADGKVYDSKSRFSRVTRAFGLEEIGNERVKPRPRIDERREHQERIEAIRRAMGDYGFSE